MFAPPEPAMAGWTALVADGSDPACRLTGDALRRIGIRRVTAVRDGAAAMSALSALVPDLLILDWDLPVVPAREIAAIARTAKRADGVAPAVIALMATPTRAAVDAALAASCDGILVRPYSPAALRARLERARPV